MKMPIHIFLLRNGQLAAMLELLLVQESIGIVTKDPVPCSIPVKSCKAILVPAFPSMTVDDVFPSFWSGLCFFSDNSRQMFLLRPFWSKSSAIGQSGGGAFLYVAHTKTPRLSSLVLLSCAHASDGDYRFPDLVPARDGG